MALTDTFGRSINYLRLSVTDRCNMRCLYCMPSEGIRLLPQDDILSYEKLLLIAKAAVASGIEKIRVTGGEPLVRKGIIPFLERLSVLPGLKHLVLTTNALLLEEMSKPLFLAGVQRLNISLDSLKPHTFAGITRGAELARVLEGISAAEGTGFPIKINMVVMKGVNDDEIPDFAAMTLERNVSVRFIEYMPAIRAENWESYIVPGKHILERIGRRFSYSAVERDGLSGPAKLFRIQGASAEFGIISAVSGHFCGECNRVRVTASGRARSCLFAEAGCDLNPYLSAGDEPGLLAALQQLVTDKPDRHSLSQPEHKPFAMSSIGG